MAAISTIIAGVGLAIGAAGTVASVAGANAAADASKRAEALREKQMNLESARQRRAVIRNMLKARATSLVNATIQGAAGGSALPGAYGQINQQAGENTLGINQGQEIGAGVFSANRDSAGASSLVAFGGGLSSLGGSLIDNSATIGRVATYASGGSIR